MQTQDLLVPLILSIVIPFVLEYLGATPGNLRRLANKKKNSRLRRRLVRLCVDAVRGRSRDDEVRLLGLAALALPLLVLVGGTALYVRNLQSGVQADRAIGQLRIEIDTLQESLSTGVQHGEPQAEPQPERNAKPETTLNSWIDKSNAVIDDLEYVQASLPWIKAVCLLTAVAGALLGLFLSWWVIPSAITRSRFAASFDRFSLRIQGLAKREELAKLAALEPLVHNEETLRCYVRVMLEIARRHHVEGIIEPFAVWDDV